MFIPQDTTSAPPSESFQNSSRAEGPVVELQWKDSPNPDVASVHSDNTSSGLSEDELRDTWTGGLDFLFSCIGYAVGLGNVWRFPYLCYDSGGGAFLIPYMFFAVVVAVPSFLLEISFGQFASLSPIAIWKISPLFKGLGYGMVIICYQVCSYYNVILAWNFYYMFNSFKEVLPWTLCNQTWNTECCINDYSTARPCGNVSTTAAEEFWDRKVLQRSPDIDHLGEVRGELLGCLVLAWVIVFFCLMGGIHSTGKIVYVTALFPYVILIALFIRGIMSEGSGEGIKFYMSPDFEKLKEINVWFSAASQIFYSVGTAWGVLITMSSYNKFNNNVISDAIIVPVVNCSTSIFAGFVVFSILGFMAHTTGREVKDVVTSGFGLAFIAYPEAAGQLPAANVWCFAFFMMIFTIGLDSQFSMFETMTSAFVDEFPQFRRFKAYITLALILSQLLIGILYVSEGGIYILKLVDNYAGAFSVMAMSFLECIVITWIYGVKRFEKDIELMIGKKPPVMFGYMWKYITPATTLAVYTIGLSLQDNRVTYGTYIYPSWGVLLGMTIGVVSLFPLPILAAIAIYYEKGPILQRLKKLIYPTVAYGPILEENYQLYVMSLSEKELERSNHPHREQAVSEIEKSAVNIRRRSIGSMIPSKHISGVNSINEQASITDVIVQK